MNLDGRTALVTGASTGIGREISRVFGENGAQVALVARSREGLRKTRDIIEGAGGEADIFQADLRSEADIEELWSEIQESLGHIDILVNAAGVWHDESSVYYGPGLEETPTEQIHEVLDVGIRAPLLLTRLVLPGMIDQKEGKILNISGTFESGASGWLHYFVAKKAIEDFTIGLADEVSEHGIQVNCIRPSDTLTEAFQEFFPDYDEEDVLDPEEIASLALFLVSDTSDHITGEITEIRNKDAY